MGHAYGALCTWGAEADVLAIAGKAYRPISFLINTISMCSAGLVGTLLHSLSDSDALSWEEQPGDRRPGWPRILRR